MNDEINTIILNDETGAKVEFEFLDLLNYRNEEYIVLLPVEDCEEGGEVVILKVEDSGNDDEEAYVSIEDEDTLMAVFEAFKNKYKDEFNFSDD